MGRVWKADRDAGRSVAGTLTQSKEREAEAQV